MRIITFNLNGIRSADRRGFFSWMRRQGADVVCVQELKAQHDDLPKRLLAPRGWHAHFHPAQRRGYSGVGIYTRHRPDNVIMGLGIDDIDQQGRYLQLDFGNLSVVSLYLPSGSSGEVAQARKFSFMERFLPRLESLARCGREFVLCGDFNIAHKEIDLRNWRSNRKNSGFLPEERQWLTRVFEGHGFVDVFRVVDPRPERYTFWSNRGASWEKNVGWRIDYQIATPGVAAKAVAADIYLRKRFSDHAPLTIDYEHAL